MQPRATQAKGLIWVEAEGYALCAYPALAGSAEPGDLRISLVKDEPIAGQVVGPDNRPVAGATIRAWFKHSQFFVPADSSKSQSNSYGFPVEVNSGADGRYLLRGMPGGTEITWFDVRHQEYVEPQSSLEVLKAGQSSRLRLTAGCKVSGVVVDEAGQPVAGADVQVRQPESAGYERRTRTNGDGEFRFANVSEGRWTIFIQPRRHAAAHGTVVATVDHPVTNQYVLQPGSYIRGKAIGADGAPLEDVAVGWAMPVDEHGQKVTPLELNRLAYTAKDGTFRFGPVSRGLFELTGSASNPRRIGYTCACANSADVLIQLKPENRP